MFQEARNKALSCPELCHLWSPMEAYGSGDLTTRATLEVPLDLKTSQIQFFKKKQVLD